MKALVGAFVQEKALVGAFSVIVKTNCETNGSYAALSTLPHLECQLSLVKLVFLCVKQTLAERGLLGVGQEHAPLDQPLLVGHLVQLRDVPLIEADPRRLEQLQVLLD